MGDIPVCWQLALFGNVFDVLRPELILKKRVWGRY
jgi:hypothetical protein